jgi:hypothetical protein
MRKPVHITVPRLTHEEMVRHLRISKTRKKELQALVDEFLAKFPKQEEAPANSIEPEKRRKSASAA